MSAQQTTHATSESQAPAQPCAPASLPVAIRALLLAAGCGFVYLLIIGGFRFDFRQTISPHHLFMADAMLHGQLHIRPETLEWKRDQLIADARPGFDRFAQQTGQVATPDEREAFLNKRAVTIVEHDWAVYEGRHYGYWGPLTPVAMMPFVALFGVGVSDHLISMLFGTVNVGLFYWLLWRVDRAGLFRMEESCRVALTLVLALGTSHFWLTCAGQVWFTVQLVTLTAILLALIAACSAGNSVWQYLLAGACFGAAILGRTTVILLGLFFILLIWMRCRDARPPAEPHPRSSQRLFVLRAAAFCLPLVAALGVQALYNYARFGDPRQSGLEIQIRTAGNQRFLPDFEQYGALSLHYFPRNFKYYFWNCTFPRQADGLLTFDKDGNSIFLMTPPLLFMLLAWRNRTLFAAALVAGIVPLVLVLLLFNGTGWVQFGPRYLLDATPLLLLLAAVGMRGRLTHVSYALCALALAVQLFGVSRICPHLFGAAVPWLTEWTLGAAVLAAIVIELTIAGMRSVPDQSTARLPN